MSNDGEHREPPFERTRLSAATDPVGHKRRCIYRWRVSYESYELAQINEEQVTSESPTAQRVEGGTHSINHLTAEEVRWLHGVLGELVARMDREGCQ